MAKQAWIKLRSRWICECFIKRHWQRKSRPAATNKAPTGPSAGTHKSQHGLIIHAKGVVGLTEPALFLFLKPTANRNWAATFPVCSVLKY